MAKARKSGVIIDDLLVFALGILTILPATTKGNYLRVAIAAVALVFALIHGLIHTDAKPSFSVYCFVLIMLMILSVLISISGVLFAEGTLVSSSVFHEVERIIFVALLIGILYKRNCSLTTVYLLCLVVFGITFAVQIMQTVAPDRVNAFLAAKYIETGEASTHLLLSTETGQAFRAGSIYINPNICGQVVSFCIPVFLERFKVHKGILPVLLVFAALVSIVLSGSRTGMVVTAVIIVVYVWKSGSETKSRFQPFLIICMIAAVVAYLIMTSASSKYRAFDLQSGWSMSLHEKIQIFVSYITTANPVELITGSIGSKNYVQIDAEWGYVVSYYGLLGLIWYSMFLVLLLKRKCLDRVLNVQYFLLMVLCMFTSTIILCLPICSMFLALTLTQIQNKTNIYSRGRMNERP